MTVNPLSLFFQIFSNALRFCFCNSPRIAQQSSLLVTEDDFAKAAGAKKVIV
jgi:hypothetical protein